MQWGMLLSISPNQTTTKFSQSPALSQPSSYVSMDLPNDKVGFLSRALEHKGPFTFSLPMNVGAFLHEERTIQVYHEPSESFVAFKVAVLTPDGREIIIDNKKGKTENTITMFFELPERFMAHLLHKSQLQEPTKIISSSIRGVLGENSCQINLNQPRTATGYYKNTIAALISPYTTAKIDLQKVHWSALKYLHVADGVKPIKGSFPAEIRESFKIVACCFSYGCKDYTKCTAKSVAWARAGYTTKPLLLDPTGKELEWKSRKRVLRVREEEMEKERKASIEKDKMIRPQFLKSNLCKWYLEGRIILSSNLPLTPMDPTLTKRNDATLGSAPNHKLNANTKARPSQRPFPVHRAHCSGNVGSSQINVHTRITS